MANSWTKLTPPSDLDARYMHAATASGATGALASFWGGYGSYTGSGSDRNNGATYDDSTGTWKSIPAPSDTAFANSRRYNTVMWWGAGKLWIWGGQRYYSPTPVNNGASYDPSTDTWKEMPATNAPSTRYYHTVVWTGAEAIIWGGYGVYPTYYLNDGKIYRP